MQYQKMINSIKKCDFSDFVGIGIAPVRLAAELGVLPGAPEEGTWVPPRGPPGAARGLPGSTPGSPQGAPSAPSPPPIFHADDKSPERHAGAGALFWVCAPARQFARPGCLIRRRPSRAGH